MQSPETSQSEPGSPWVRELLYAFLPMVPLLVLVPAQPARYLLFHTVGEVFAVVIACGVFMVAWNARRFLNNGYLLLMGTASLSIAALDLAHTLAYKGMRIFPVDGANTATQLWMAARFVAAVSLLIAPFFLRHSPRLLWLVASYTSATTVLLLSIFWWRVFPVCYVDEVGLTTFKVAGEYAICLALVGAIVLLCRERSSFAPEVFAALVGSIVLTILSELSFTLYKDIYGIANFVGHYLKIISFYLLYKAVIQTGFARPYALLLRENLLREQQLRRAKEELNRANAELEHRVQQRTASLQETTENLNTFVYSIAHDLRAPLRAQHGFAKMLLESHKATLDAEGLSFLERISSAAIKLDGLVSDLLNYVTVSREKPALTVVDLARVAAQVRAQFGSQLKEQQAVISIDASNGLVLADEASLHRALWHLIDNGLKFVKPAQTPRITLRAERQDPWIRLWVEDEGIGVAPQYHSKLFGVFQRLHVDGDRPGHGIGLAIVRKSVELMGGRVGVESEVNQGCRFWIELPQAGHDLP